MIPVETVELKPRTWQLLIPMILLSTGFIIIIEKGPPVTGINFIFFTAISVLFLVWLGLRKQRLIIDNDGITVKTVFNARQVLWKDVVNSFVKNEFHGKSSKNYWYFQTADNNDFKIHINYSRKNLRTLAEIVVDKCRHARIQDRVYKMAEGIFPWYIF
jgi:hypothetical protein